MKTGSRFHPSKPAVILSGFVVSLFQALQIGPQMRVPFGTAKPDTRHETGHLERLISERKSLVFGMFRLVSAYFAIPDNITAGPQTSFRMVEPRGFEPLTS
jgi:hypothetical protein